MPSYEQILLMLREDSTQASLEDMLKADLANKGRMNIYRIVIQGTRAPELLLLPERLKSFGYVTEVLDESKPSYDLEALQKKYSGTLIGDYISYFLEKDRNAVEEKALYYGAITAACSLSKEDSTSGVMDLKEMKLFMKTNV